MTVTGADRVFAATLVAAKQYRTFTAMEVREVTREFGDDAPARKTVYNHLDALSELGVLCSVGSRNSMRRYHFSDSIDPEKITP